MKSSTSPTMPSFILLYVSFSFHGDPSQCGNFILYHNGAHFSIAAQRRIGSFSLTKDYFIIFRQDLASSSRVEQGAIWHREDMVRILAI